VVRPSNGRVNGVWAGNRAPLRCWSACVRVEPNQQEYPTSRRRVSFPPARKANEKKDSAPPPPLLLASLFRRSVSRCLSYQASAVRCASESRASKETMMIFFWWGGSQSSCHACVKPASSVRASHDSRQSYKQPRQCFRSFDHSITRSIQPRSSRRGPSACCLLVPLALFFSPDSD